MKLLTAAALLLATAAGAAAQSYQTALPLSPAERRAMEARLAPILENAPADQMRRFRLPSGRTVSVLPYRMVRSGVRPCRGYRIDLEGRQSRIAVDGFRCQRRRGGNWVIVEPELVLAQEGPQRRNRPAGSRRAANEPLYADDLFTAPPSSDTPPPVPRPSPNRNVAATDEAPASTTDSDGEGDVASVASQTATTPARPVADGGDTAARPEFSSRVTAALSEEDVPDAPADVSPPASEEPSAVAAASEAPARSETRPAASVRPVAAATTPITTEPTRVVQEAEAPPEDDFSQNETVVAGLTDLAYLMPGETVTRESVDRAVDEFAVDERFALPVPTDILIARLDAAIERSQSLPDCDTNSLADLCALAVD